MSHPPLFQPLQLLELKPRRLLLGEADNLKLLRELFGSGQRAVILEGPPGTGKTLLAEELARQLSLEVSGKQAEECRLTSIFPDFLSRYYSDDEIAGKIKLFAGAPFIWDLIVLHSSYQYEDLVRGFRIRPGATGTNATTAFDVVEGIVGFTCRVVAGMNALGISGLLILDEINRAPIGRIFGEMLYAMDRRGKDVATAYPIGSKDKASTLLSFPPGLVLVGTMNSSDRSASGFDYALRRRFDFVSLRPDRTVLEQFWKESPLGNLVLSVFDSTGALIDQATSMEVLAKSDLQVGHGYFIPNGDWYRENRQQLQPLQDWLARTLVLRVYTLLRDYQEQGLLRFPDDSEPYKNPPGLSGAVLSGTIPLPKILEVKEALSQK